MRILLVQKNDNEASSSLAALEAAGYVPDRVGDADEALDFLREYEYDLVVLEGSPPDGDGCRTIQRIRGRKIMTPVLLLTTSNEAGVVIAALRAGADDVLLKPLRPNEMVARIETIVRRCCGYGTSTLRVGPMIMDLASQEVLVNGIALDCTRKEFQILQLLTLRKGKVIAREGIANLIYNALECPGSRVVDVFVCNLRKKLASLGAVDLITTVRGSGYVIRAHAPAASGRARSAHSPAELTSIAA